jgi:NADH-quinone oxidoreductase subunit L
MPQELYWFIFLLPVISFGIISVLLKPFVSNNSKIPGYLTILAIAGSCALSVWALSEVIAAPHHEIEIEHIEWLVIGEFEFSVSMIMDSLTAVMLVAVTFVSLMVQIYSLAYLHKDASTVDTGFPRYYAWMSLFTASMLGLVLAGSLLMMFIFWEMVGVCSYLLIGFWFHKPSAANAAKKAFIVTRLGDFGFLAAVLLLFSQTGTFDTMELREMAIAGTLAGSVLTWAAIGIFSGAAGKSAQFPLHVWLPDAMEGPTPVSALIHSATMVSAGVFLVARTFPLFENSAQALQTVAVIGGFTAIFAASMGLVMHDIKRVLAYSTISQLGFMMLGLAAGGVAVGIFHLFTHAFFKSLLFLGAGSVSHASGGTFDMRKMGGLRKYMPWTYTTFLIGSLSLAGIWPLAGFWSKDEILVKALENQPIVFVLAMITVFMTAFYMFRAVFITFGGEFRGGEQSAHDSHGGGHGSHNSHPHESPALMTVPMILLAVLAIIAGFWNVTGEFGSFMGHGEPEGTFMGNLVGIFTHSALPLLSLVIALAGIFVAYAIYSAKWLSAEKLGNSMKALYTLLSNKYYFDKLYEDIIVRKVLMSWIFGVFQKFDANIVDGTVNGAASGTARTGGVMRKWEVGQLQLYGLFMAIGVLAIIIALFIFG